MIIREYDTAFVMIEQDHHAEISASIIKQWQNILFKNDPLYPSVLYAIRHHDCGWRLFDSQPFWNNQKQAPFAFTDFPNSPKTVLYTQGIDEVEKIDAYAAALCSAHYTKFVERRTDEESSHFVNQEKERRNRIIGLMDQDSVKDFDKHLSLLKFADNLSLYLCLNEPAVPKEAEHVFFKRGIPISGMIWGLATDVVQVEWKDTETILINGLPYIPPFSVFLQQKVIKKREIDQIGLIKAYETTPSKIDKISFKILS